MHPIEHPETILLIHDEFVRREVERYRRQRIGRDDIPGPNDHDEPGRFRRAISRGLISLARRIAPTEPVDSGLPAGIRH